MGATVTAKGWEENISLGDRDHPPVSAYLVTSELNRNQFMVSPLVDVSSTFQQYPFWELVEEKGTCKRFARLDRSYSMNFAELKSLNQYYIVLTSADSTTLGTSWTVLSTDTFHRETGMVLVRSWTDDVVVTCIPKDKLLMFGADGSVLGTDPDEVELAGAKQTVEAIWMGMPGPEIFLKVPGVSPPAIVDLPSTSVSSEDPSDESSDSESQPQAAGSTGDPPRLVPGYMLDIFQRAGSAGFSEREVMGAMKECGGEDPVDWLKKQQKVIQYFRRKTHGQQVEDTPPGLTRGSKDIERQTRRLMVEEELTWDQAWAAVLLLWTKKWQGYGKADILSAVRSCGEEPDLRDVMQHILWSINDKPNMVSPSCL
ncbi:hypothetical protein Bbelb_151930 [Branchiostoma belcheri]|nr:hypothetical protein Bbelb_151930 [Branchiostoma belcheri]